MQDAEARKNNLMIFGLRESDDISPEKRKQSDIRRIERLASEINVDFSEPQSVIRLGRVGDKPRPVKIIGLSSNTRDSMLRSAHRVRAIDKSLGLDRVYIKPDLTLKQQLTERNIRAEFRSRRDKGESVRIRNGKVIAVSDTGPGQSSE